MSKSIRNRLLAIKKIISIFFSTLNDFLLILGLSIPNELANKIALKSNRNLRRALLMCETAYVAHYPFTNDQEINEPDWEVFLRETAKQILQKQTVEQVMLIRDRLYELLCHCIPADIIFKVKISKPAHDFYIFHYFDFREKINSNDFEFREKNKKFTVFKKVINRHFDYFLLF